MDISGVRAAVEETHARIGAATPGWPNPRPDFREARPEEYSRCLDPEKYRIVGTRARAWAAALTGLGLAIANEVPTGVRLRPARAGAVPLFLELMVHQGVPEGFLILRAGDADVEISRHPDCGCDACDFGSQDLIDHLDDEVAHVVSGALVHVEIPGRELRSTSSGWSAAGTWTTEAVEATLADAAAGRSPYPVIHGPAWWDSHN